MRVLALLCLLAISGITVVHSESEILSIGCYVDKEPRDLSSHQSESATNTIESCIGNCKSKGYKYAGLQAGAWCYCGNTYGRHGKASDSECSYKCQGNYNQVCGGEMHNSIYETKDFVKCECVQKTPTYLAVAAWAKNVGLCFVFRVTGSKTGSVYGDGTYTSDSSLGPAAIHAGLLTDGQTKYVRVKVLPGRASYVASTKNGITTIKFNSFALSYKFSGTASSDSACEQECQCAQSTPSNMAGYTEKIGECFEFRVTGDTSGEVWGDGTYTSDSAIGAAAVHSGLLKKGETKFMRIGVLPGQDSYLASTKNGVKSTKYGTYKLGYKFHGASSSSYVCQ